MLPRLARRVAGRLGRSRSNRLVRASASVVRPFLQAFDERDLVARHDPARNGEELVLERLAGHGITTIFDVGANVGDWAAMARRHHPGASIHCFEISPPTATQLQTRLGDDDGIVVNAFGLGAEPGTIKIRHFEGQPTLTTATDYPHDSPWSELDGEVRRGDDYVASQRIERVGFLKIDVEGGEEGVLRGFADSLARGVVDVIQFEYGRVAILTKFQLREFYEVLAPHGYVIGKIGPNGVAFREYAFSHEDFDDANFLAVRSERRDVIDAVGRV